MPDVFDTEPLPFAFTEDELRGMAVNPYVLKALMDYHEAQQTEADAAWDGDDCPKGNERRKQSLYERGRSIMSEDLEVWPDDLRVAFGFPAYQPTPNC